MTVKYLREKSSGLLVKITERENGTLKLKRSDGKTQTLDQSRYNPAVYHTTYHSPQSEHYRAERMYSKVGLPKLPVGLKWNIKIDPLFSGASLQIINRGTKEIVSESWGGQIPKTKKEFVSYLKVLKSEILIPEYNPFDLNYLHTR